MNTILIFEFSEFFYQVLKATDPFIQTGIEKAYWEVCFYIIQYLPQLFRVSMCVCVCVGGGVYRVMRARYCFLFSKYLYQFEYVL